MPRKANRGSFRPGPDPRRHRFTKEQRKRGYANAVAACQARPGKEGWDAYAWLFRRIRGYYRHQREGHLENDP